MLSLFDLVIFAVITGLIVIATKCPRYKRHYSPPMRETTYEANEMVSLASLLYNNMLYLHYKLNYLISESIISKKSTMAKIYLGKIYIYLRK